MKKVLLLFYALTLSFCAVAQEEEEIPPRIVDSLPHNRKVVIEQYTGINSPFCPTAHKLVANYAATHPDSVFIINIHTGGYAPQFRTVKGDALAQRAGFHYYPEASINQKVFADDSVMSIKDTGLWKTYGDQILNMPSFVNIAARAELNYLNKEVHIHVEAFYTGIAETSENIVNVAILQDDIIGKQKGKENNPAQVIDGKYNHKYMFRDMFSTPIFVKEEIDGVMQTISPVDSGTFFQWDTSFFFPDELGMNGDKVKTEFGKTYFLVYITQDANKEIYTATKANISFTNVPEQITLKEMEAKLEPVLGCNNSAIPSLTIKNESDSIIRSLQISCLTLPRVHWTGILNPFENLSLTFDTVAVTLGSTTTISFTIDTVNGLGLETGTPYFSAVASLTKPDITKGKGVPTLLLKCDRWGSEVTWNLYDGDFRVIQSGGPYPNYETPPAVPDTILLSAIRGEGCYIFEIKDAYGDGINTVNGAGFYKVIDGEGALLISSNGKYEEGEKNDFLITSMVVTVGMDDLNGAISQSAIYPNPAQNHTTLTLSLTEAAIAQITITDILGRETVNIGTKALKIGDNNIEINTSSMNSGIYFVNIITEEHGTLIKKLAVKK